MPQVCETYERARALRGIDPVRISRWSWALGGAFCALTGYLASPVLNASTGMGVALLLKGFVGGLWDALGPDSDIAVAAGQALLVDDGFEDLLARRVLVADRHQHAVVLAVLVRLVAEPDRRGLAATLELIGEDR